MWGSLSCSWAPICCKEKHCCSISVIPWTTTTTQHTHTPTHLLAPALRYMSNACSSLASLQVNNRCVCVVSLQGMAEEWGKGCHLNPSLIQQQPWAADKAVVLDVNYCHLLCWGKFIRDGSRYTEPGLWGTLQRKFEGGMCVYVLPSEPSIFLETAFGRYGLAPQQLVNIWLSVSCWVGASRVELCDISL